tara:strand:- start:35902 stop:36558 length:657 start_codon:yes stop_codon:yes gene_type:complete
MYKNLIVILSLISCMPAYGQDMLIEQIAGKEVVRKTFNDDKELTAKQVFKVGELQTTGNQLSVQLQVSLFDEDGELEDKYLTKFTCEPGKSDVLLAVFPFARQGNAEYVIEASSPGFKRLYDFDADDKTLPNLSLEMSIESGVLSFFGSKSVVAISDRKVSTSSSGFTLTSRLTIKAYMWGLKVKTITYQVTEKLDKNQRLISQVFREEDGSYFLMNY